MNVSTTQRWRCLALDSEIFTIRGVINLQVHTLPFELCASFNKEAGRVFLRTTLVAAAIAVAAVGLAAPSHADNDDPASDETFGMLLDNHGLLFNFRLEKYQGQRYCRSVIEGDTPNDAIHDLMRNGSYSFDVANGIASAAMV